MINLSWDFISSPIFSNVIAPLLVMLFTVFFERIFDKKNHKEAKNINIIIVNDIYINDKITKDKK